MKAQVSHDNKQTPTNGFEMGNVTALAIPDVRGPDKTDRKNGNKAVQANADLLHYMNVILDDGRQEAQQLRRKQKNTYRLLIILSTLMFLIGLMLITAPLWLEMLRVWLQIYYAANAPVTTILGKIDQRVFSAGLVGLGVLDLVALYQTKPLARIQKLMGDMSQMTVTFNSFQTRVALGLLEADIQKRHTIGAASKNIKAITNDTVLMIDTHFEKWLGKELDVQPSTEQA